MRPLVIHVIDSLDISGGAERQLVANLTAFNHDEIAHEVVVLKTTSTTREGELDGIAPLHLLFDQGEEVTRTRMIVRLKRLVRELDPTLMHASLSGAGLAARIVGRMEGVPVVESLVNISHEPIRTVDNPSVTITKLRFHALLDRFTMRSLAGFHAVSQAVADSWTRVVGIDRDKIEIIPRGVELQNFDMATGKRQENRESVLAEFGFPGETTLVISVGRVEPQKGHRYLVEAFSEVMRRLPGARLLIVGRRGQSAAAIEELIAASGLSQDVVLTGPRRDVRRLLSAADLFAFPSLYEGNGGNAMIEAMAAGLPIITTNAAPMTDLVPDESTGILIGRRDVAGLAEAIARLVGDEELRKTLGAAARSRASNLPSPQEVVERFEEWYHMLLGEPS